MKERKLPKLTKTQILLGELYPYLLQLRDSEQHGPAGELDIFFKGFRIKWENKNPVENHSTGLL